MEELTRRRRVADRFLDYPLVVMFILSPAFPVVLGGLVLLGIGAGLCLPRIWVTSAAGFEPEVRVRAIHLAMAWRLKRSALRYEAAGRLELANRAWRRAVGYNRANVETVQSALGCFLRLKDPGRGLVRQAVSQAFWLMRLTSTNRASLDIVSAVFLKSNAPEVTLAQLRAHQAQLSPAQETSFLKALFLVGRVSEYHQRWKRVGQGLPPDPELELCQAAYDAGWGPVETMTDARRRLQQAQENPDRRAFACRLEMVVCAKLQDADCYEANLRRLQDEEKDLLTDYLGYWRLLASVGRLAEARRLAEDHLRPPANAWEVMQMGTTLVDLSAFDYAQRFFARYAPALADVDDPETGNLWVSYADLLLQMRKWDDLLALGMRMRTLPRARSMLTGYSYFLEGRALLASGRPEEAQPSFQRAADASFPIPAAGMQVASDLLRLGYPELAEKVLAPLEKNLAGSPRYWETLFEVAYTLKRDEALLLRAATKARALEPQKMAHDINYAAALLVVRQEPDEAAKITLTFLKAHPNSLVARVDHSFALTMNKRFPDAMAILQTINPKALGELESTIYHLCWLEVHFGQKQFDQAKEDLKLIQTKYLFPTQLRWLEDIRQQVDANAG